MTPAPKPTPIRHRMRMPGVASCGATERTGAKFSNLRKFITCPVCVELVDSRRAAAKERARKAGAA